MGDNNIFREGVTVNRSTQEGQATVIGSNCYLMNNCHIAHDCVVGDDNILASAAHLAGHVHIGNKIFFGAGAMIHQFCRIGSLCMIRGISGVTKDIIPFTMAGGFPVLHYRLNVVGIKRSGIDGDRLKTLSSAFRLLRKREAFDTLDKTPEVIELENWLAEKSLRGIHRFAGK
jgi:UDP-N-acetylglucosamine acyltransferase